MSQSILLEIVAPHSIELRKEVDFVLAPTQSGYEGILPGHIRLLTTLATGVLKYQVKGTEYYLAVSEGFMEVTPHKIIILAEIAELSANIDVETALQNKREAEDSLYSYQSNFDFVKAQAKLQLALAKLEVIKKSEEHNLINNQN